MRYFACKTRKSSAWPRKNIYLKNRKILVVEFLKLYFIIKINYNQLSSISTDRNKYIF